MARRGIVELQQRRSSSSRRANADQQAPAPAQAAAGATAAAAPGAAASAAPRPATRCWRRWSRGCSRSSRSWSATRGLLHDQRPVRDHQHARAGCPGRKSLMFFSEGHRDSAGGPATVPRRHRRREPRQRQHLHDGRGGPARRERAGQDPRPGEQRRGRRRRHSRRSGGAAASRCRRRSRRTRTCSGRIRTPASARWRRAPAACSSTAPTTCARASTASRPICATTTSSATRRATTPTTARFRTIEVKVKRPASRSRRARATSPSATPAARPINAWEAPALGELERKPVPNAFPVRAGAFLFPERDRPGLVPVVVESEDGAADVPAGRGRQDLHVGFRGARAVPRWGEPGRPQGEPALRGHAARSPRSSARNRGKCIFYREPELPPGVYTMETVVYDAPSGKSSVRFSTVEVPAAQRRRRCA